MTVEQLANVLQFSVVAILALFVFFKMLPEWRLDSFRQSMFVVRDELFDYAADGNISFDHQAYMLLRRQMNGFIRYGHHLTLFRGMLTIAIHKISGTPARPSWHEEWQKALDTIQDASIREKMEQFHRRGMVFAIQRLVTSSPILITLTFLFMIEFVFQGVRQSIWQLAKNAAKRAFTTSRMDDRLIEQAAFGEFA